MRKQLLIETVPTNDNLCHALIMLQNAVLNIERQALKMLAGVGSRTTETHVEWTLDPSGQSAMKRENTAEERRPSSLCQFGTGW